MAVNFQEVKKWFESTWKIKEYIHSIEVCSSCQRVTQCTDSHPIGLYEYGWLCADCIQDLAIKQSRK